MPCRILQLVTVAIVLATAARADLTIRYKSGFKLSAGLPAPMADMMKQQMGNAVPSQTSIRIKGDRLFSEHGLLTSIVDYGKGQLTLLHVPTKRYATIPVADFSKQLNTLLPPGAREAMRDIKVDVKSEKSGKTAVIHGLSAEEIVLTMSLDMPGPGGAPMQMRMELHNWLAAADALKRSPELKEWDAKKWATMGGFDPTEMMSSAFAPGPAMEKLRDAMREMTTNSTGLSLKHEARVFMPMIAQMLQAQGASGGDGPIVETVTELDTFNSDPIPDSVFQIPADYKPAPFEELMREANPNKPQIPKQ